MTNDNAKTRIELEIVQTGDAKEKLDQVAAAADKAADAEKRLADQTENANTKLEQQRTPSSDSPRPSRGTASDKATGPGGDPTAARNAEAQKTILEKILHTLAAQGRGAGATAGAVLGKGNEDGVFGKMGSTVGMVAAAVGGYMLLSNAAKSAVEGVKTLSNESLSTAQKTRALAESFIPGVKSIREFAEAVTGTSEKLRMNEITFSDLTLKMQQAFQVRMRSMELGREQYAATSAVAGTKAAAYGDYRTYDRSTAYGQIAYQDNQQRMQAEDEKVRAQRRRAAASSTAAEAAAVAEEKSRAVREAIKERDKLGTVARIKGGLNVFGNAGRAGSGEASQLERLQGLENAGYRDKAKMDTALREYDAAQQNVIQRIKEEEQAILELKDKQLKARQAESDVRKADINTLKAEAAILERRESRMSEGQKRLGGMHEGEIMLGETLVDQARAQGNIEGFTPQMLQYARSVAPGEIDKMMEARGEKHALRFAEKGYDVYRQDYEGGKTRLGDVRSQGDKVQADVRVAIDLDEKKLAQDIAAALGPVIAQLKAISATMAKAEADKARSGRQVTFNLQF